MNKQHFIGFDPGTVSGSIAVIAPDDSIRLFKMPLLPKVGTYNRHDPTALHSLLLPYTGAIVVVESVCFGGRDDQHKTSAEMLIRSHESFLTICAVLGIQVRNMETPAWRKMAGSYLLGTDEQAICEYAANLFPSVKNELIVKKKRGEGYIYNHNFSESLLMAYCARLIHYKDESYQQKIRSLPQPNRERPATHKNKPIS